MSDVRIETTYDPVQNRYRAAVMKGDEVLYICVRAKREAAEYGAQSYITHQLS